MFRETGQPGIWEVWGCLGAWHGPYEEIPSNFGRVWFYRTWGKSIFMFCGNIGNSLHHQIPPNLFSGLQIGPWIFLKATVRSQELSNKLSFHKMTKTNKYVSEKCHSLGLPSFFVKMATPLPVPHLIPIGDSCKCRKLVL